MTYLYRAGEGGHGTLFLRGSATDVNFETLRTKVIVRVITFDTSSLICMGPSRPSVLKVTVPHAKVKATCVQGHFQFYNHGPIKLCSHQAKTKAKAKIFFDVCR